MKAFDTWCKRLQAYEQGEPIPESLIIEAGRIISGSTRGKFSEDELTIMQRELTFMRVPITQAQTEKGLRWLRSNFKKFNPALRRVINQFDHFMFMGIDTTNHRPKYMVVDKQGGWFVYTAHPFRTEEKLVVIAKGAA